jgi:anhydro-N-acetylmuramic acid kinase
VLTIGLMSGTSLDGVDGVLVRWVDSPGQGNAPPQRLAGAHVAFPQALRAELLALNTAGPDELHRAALAANALARLYADVALALLAHGGVAAGDVDAIGAHGQTVRHRPQAFDGCGYTLQLLNPALLAERTGIPVVADLRSRDLAAGGQGAPLVPAFHALCFADPRQDVAVLNLGGIANLTLLPASGPVGGFDCGPGNVLMDLWCQRVLALPFDAGGAVAATGTPLPALLRACQAEPFFALPSPKSTGRDLFNDDWLGARLAEAGAASAAQADVLATLAELTAWAAAQDLRAALPGARRLAVCGGGARNVHLLARLAALAAPAEVVTTDALGVPADAVEALAFAWLARAHLLGLPGNLTAVTGAAQPRVLGTLTPRR